VKRRAKALFATLGLVVGVRRGAGRAQKVIRPTPPNPSLYLTYVVSPMMIFLLNLRSIINLTTPLHEANVIRDRGFFSSPERNGSYLNHFLAKTNRKTSKEMP
jgi:hypothetical protein